MRYDLLLADADGTLFDFHAGEKRALTETLIAFGMEPNEDTLATYSRINQSHWKRLERGETTQARLRVERFEDFLREMVQRGACGTSLSPEALGECFVEALSRQRVPMSGSEAFLRRISAQMPVYLVTNGISRVQRGRFEASELRPYFKDILISEELGHFKPDPFMVLEAMRRAGVTDKRRVVLLGDSVTADIGAALNAGVDSVLFTAGLPAPENSGATYVVQTLQDAADRVLSI